MGSEERDPATERVAGDSGRNLRRLWIVFPGGEGRSWRWEEGRFPPSLVSLPARGISLSLHKVLSQISWKIPIALALQ